MVAGDGVDTIVFVEATRKQITNTTLSIELPRLKPASFSVGWVGWKAGAR